jgi:DegV family protein with EDD domain
MASKIGIVVCGNSGVDYMKLNYPVKVIRSTLNLGGKEYEDFVDITAEKFYETIVSNPDIDVSTAQTATGKIAQVYESLKAEGYQDILVVTISSKLSGTFQGANLAVDLVEGVNVKVIDSRTVSYGEAYLVLEAIRLIEAGKTLDQIAAHLEQVKEKITIYVLVDTLKYLVKNGRLSNVSGMLGTLLKIKPLLRLKSDGALVPYEKIRTTAKAQARLFEILSEEIKEKKVKAFVVYTNNKDKALSLKEELLQINGKMEVEVVPLTPVVGAHAGPGTLAVGYIEQ